MLVVNDLDFKKIKKEFNKIIFIQDKQEVYRISGLVKQEMKKIKRWYGNNDVKCLAFASENENTPYATYNLFIVLK